MLLTFTAISVTVTDDNDPENAATINKRVKHHGAHFGILTNTSLFTWDVFNKKVKPEDFSSHIKTLKSVKKHPVWLVRTFIGVACGCLCMLAGGDWKNGVIAAIAAFAGLTVRQIMVKHNFNLMIAIVSAAFISTSIAGIDILFHIGQYPERTVATSVLYLIPGVPLINCIIDLIEGYIPTALARGAFGGFILLCIAVGMFLSMNIIGINNF